jgi:CheY-like chemotaxis protein
MLRRELHRVRGTAGSYGFPEASEFAAALEELAIRWVADPALHRQRRASMTEEFATAFEAQLAGLPVTPPSFVTVLPAPNAVSAGGPADPVPPAGAREARVPGAGSPPAQGSSSHAPDIILVEDDPAFVEMLQYAIGTTSYSFQHYASGPEALDALLALDTGGSRPIVLLDVDLPGLDGFSLHEHLRLERPGAYETVFLTARSGEAEQLRAYRAGAIDYVSKPVNLRILLAKISSWLDRARRSA